MHSLLLDSANERWRNINIAPLRTRYEGCILYNHSIYFFQIRRFIFTDAGFNPSNDYSNDIIAIVLKKSVEMNKFVLPACIDWVSDNFQVDEGTLGKVRVVSTVVNNFN